MLYRRGYDLVIRVVDGDTVHTLFRGKIRYLWINTPEIISKDQLEYCLAFKATYYNAKLVLFKPIRLGFHHIKYDAYGRVLAVVYILNSNATIQEKLISLGVAKPLFLSEPPVDIVKKYRELYSSSKGIRQYLEDECIAKEQ